MLIPSGGYNRKSRNGIYGTSLHLSQQPRMMAVYGPTPAVGKLLSALLRSRAWPTPGTVLPSARNLKLTEEGRALFERTAALLTELAETAAAISSRAEKPRGRLRIRYRAKNAGKLSGG
ncbi:hypothetical protein FHW16_002750 [Phyllobacterium myrsinacearum]|uniref:Uncharacterized protein n=1 Tax=Phyllobacterium myrsinacearum TaxID=28101 RepID=A0A839EJJ8_9HYPH|nr:hypothetical protein [Phyllobacterium myrsinacearum]